MVLLITTEELQAIARRNRSLEPLSLIRQV